MGRLNTVLGCVADNSPRYLDQALRLLKSLRWFGGVAARCDFVLCVIDSVERKYIREFKAYGADVRIVPRFSRELPVTNKIRFLEQSDLTRYDQVVLLDCDTLVVQNPLVAIKSYSFQARLAGSATIPHDIFERMFEVFRLPLPPQEYKCILTGEPTIPYFNTGVVVLNPSLMNSLVPAWQNFVRQLLSRLELLLGHEWFIEQAALSLALAATGCRFELLGEEMNFPVHLATKSEQQIQRLVNIDPRIIHYHHWVEASGQIMLCGYPLADARIMRFNRRSLSRLRWERMIRGWFATQ
jgi:hypothetical protein